MRPWWERDPAALDADIQELTEAGFRVRREVTPRGFLTLHVERGGSRFDVAYEVQRSSGRPRLTAVALDASGEVTRLDVRLATPLVAVQALLQGRGRIPVDADAGRVLVPWASYGIRAGGGVLRLGRSATDARALAVLAVEGAEVAAALGEAGASLARPFSTPVSGLWVRCDLDSDHAATTEQLVASVERPLAKFHALSLPALRRRLRAEVGAVAEARGGDWHFVRRGPRGEPLVLRTQYVHQPPWGGERAPFAARIAHARVGLIGCGAVGWSVATQLARSGVRRFSLYDADTLSAGNLARIGGFLPSVGRLKVDALAEQLEAIAPWVRADAHPYEIGVGVGSQPLLADTPDLIVNLTAETLSTDETNFAALALEVPALYAWVSDGVQAGRILRVRPYQTPCYHCVREAELPMISERPVGADTAWEGASFDCDAFAAAVARIAVLTLANEPVSEANPDHAVLRFGGVAPVAQPVRLARDPRCAVCGSGRPEAFIEWADHRA
ncbi:MAG TPA: ThiF family adenylyltransferase [Chloroflexota bacterium]|nr:ThiF family adenylyltransferase [Chloroflexota bacterium]